MVLLQSAALDFTWLNQGQSSGDCLWLNFQIKTPATYVADTGGCSGQNVDSVKRTNAFTVEVEEKEKEDRTIRSLIILLLLVHSLDSKNRFRLNRIHILPARSTFGCWPAMQHVPKGRRRRSRGFDYFLKEIPLRISRHMVCKQNIA